MSLESVIVSIFSKNNGFIGDDCAYIKETKQLISSDTFVENVHFDFKICKLKQIAYKFLVSNLSDIQSSGGIPKYALLNISFPKSKFKNAKIISNHLKKLSDKYKIKIIGGDTTSSKNFNLSMTIISNIIDKKDVITRSNSKIGDSIYVFKNLGFSKMGYLNLYKKLKLPTNLQMKSQKQFLEPQYYDYSGIFKNMNINSCMDISDSLFESLKTMSLKSKKKFIIDDLYDVNPTIMKLYNENKEEYLNLILSSGEEYTPVFTMKSNNLKNKFKNLLKKKGILLSKIGHVQSGSGLYLNQKKLKKPNLFDHFKNSYSKQ